MAFKPQQFCKQYGDKQSQAACAAKRIGAAELAAIQTCPCIGAIALTDDVRTPILRSFARACKLQKTKLNILPQTYPCVPQ